MSAADVRYAVENAFRDYETAGVPSSGEHEPLKSDIRYALGVLLQTALESAGAGLTSYATVGDRNADTSKPVGTLAYVYRNNGSATDAANGFYQWTGSAWERAAWLDSLIENKAVSAISGKGFAAGPVSQRGPTPFQTYDNGFHWFVTDFSPPRLTAWFTAGSPDMNGDVQPTARWVGYLTPAEVKNLAIGFTGRLPQANVAGVNGYDTIADDLATLGTTFSARIADFRARALTSTAPLAVALDWDADGALTGFNLSWGVGYSVALGAGVRSFRPPLWSQQTRVTSIGDSMMEGKWVEGAAATLGLTVNNVAKYSSGVFQSYRLGTRQLLFTVTGNSIPASGTGVQVTAINGLAPSFDADPNDAFSGRRFLNTYPGDTVATNCSVSGWYGGRHGVVSVPNGGTTTYTFTPDDGVAAATAVAAQSKFVPDNLARLAVDELWIRMSQNYFYADYTPVFPNNINPRVLDDIQGVVDQARGQRIIILALTPGNDFLPGTKIYDALRYFNNQLRVRWPQYAAYLTGVTYSGSSFTGNNMDFIRQYGRDGSADDQADYDNGLLPRSCMASTDAGEVHLNAKGQALESQFLQLYRAAQAVPPAITANTLFTLTASATNPRTAAVTTASASTSIRFGAESTALQPSAIADLETAAKIGFSTLGERVATAGYTTTPAGHRWIVGGDVGTEITLSGKSVTAVTGQRLYAATGTATVRLNVIARPLTSAGLDAAPPQVGDAVYGPYDFTIASLGLTAGGAAVDARMALPVAIPAAALAGCSVLVDLRGLDAAGNPSGLGIGTRPDGTPPPRKRGLYSTVSTPNNVIAVDAGSASIAWRLETTAYLSGTGITARVSAAESAISANSTAITSNAAALSLTASRLFQSFTTVGAIASTNAYGAGSWKRWVVGGDVGSEINFGGKPLSAVTLQKLLPDATATTIRLNIIARPLASSGLDLPPPQTGDVVYGPYDYTPASLGLNSTTATDARLTLPAEIPAANFANSCVLIDIQALDASGNRVQLGIGFQAGSSSAVPQRKHGFFSLSTGSGTPSWSNVDVNTRISYTLEAGTYFSATANDGRVSAVESTVASHSASILTFQGQLISGYASLGQQIGTGTYLASSFTFTRWGVLADVGSDIVPGGNALTAIRIPRMSAGASTTGVRLRLSLRPLASSTLDGAPGAANTGDVAVSQGPNTYAEYSLSSLGITPGGSAVDVRMALPFPIAAAALANQSLVIDVQGVNSGGTASLLGVGFVSGQNSSLPGRQRGFFQTSGGWSAIGDTSVRLSWGADTTNYFSAAANETRLQGIEAALSALNPTFGTNFLLPDRLWLTEGQRLPFYWASMLPTRVDNPAFVATLESLKFMPGAAATTPPARNFSARSTEMIELDPDRIGSTVTLTLRRRGVPDVRYGKAMAATVVPWVKTGSPNILFVGDSLGQQFKVPALYQELRARGMTPTFIGDINTSSFNGNGGSGDPSRNSEARSGKAMADFTYARVYDAANGNTMKPCDDITYAQYLALPQSGGAGVDARSNRNPFLLAGSGAGFNNGYKWSLTRYLSYTGKTAPTHVFVSLGTNDIFQFSKSAAMANIAAGIALMVAEIRAAAPNTYIVFYSDGCGWRDGINGAGSYYENHHAMLQTQYSAVKSLISAGDSRLAYIPLGLHEDDNRFGDMFTARVNLTNGSPNVAVTAGTLTAGQTVVGSGVPTGTTVVTGATAGGTAVLSANATNGNSGVDVFGTDAYGLRLEYDHTVNAGYVHPTDGNILVAASVLASYVAATT